MIIRPTWPQVLGFFGKPGPPIAGDKTRTMEGEARGRQAAACRLRPVPDAAEEEVRRLDPIVPRLQPTARSA
jgi:hypothetical protein